MGAEGPGFDLHLLLHVRSLSGSGLMARTLCEPHPGIHYFPMIIPLFQRHFLSCINCIGVTLVSGSAWVSPVQGYPLAPAQRPVCLKGLSLWRRFGASVASHLLGELCLCVRL